jgi:hypothetical protein
VKRILLTLAAAVLFINTFVVPTAVRADGGATGTNCNGSMCKP